MVLKEVQVPVKQMRCQNYELKSNRFVNDEKIAINNAIRKQKAYTKINKRR